MVDRKKPNVGELWKETTHDWVFFITAVKKQELRSVETNKPSKCDWVFWDNLEKNMEGNASLAWFKANCEKIS